MDQFNSLEAVLRRFSELGAKRFFFKSLQENDNSKQQIYVSDRPESLSFIHTSWTFDAESSTPKASVDFHWVTPDEVCAAPHAKLIFYPNYPEVRLSGLLQGSKLAPREHMKPVPKALRQQQDERVLLLGVSKDGSIFAHLALSNSAPSSEARKLQGKSLITEVELGPDLNEAPHVVHDKEEGQDPTFGVIVESPDDEADDDYSDNDLFEISSWGADLSFRELINRYDDDELVKPELQRNYVWDKPEASRFIDSILLGLPVPSIFLAKTKEDKLLIIDGYQRLMTVRDFVKGIYSKDKSHFRLSRTEKIHERWRGKSFIELSSEEQRRIRNTTIHAIIFMQQQPKRGDTSLYQIFERINSSGRTLLPQEIRNCVYQGKLNSLLIDLNKDAAWRTLWGSESPDDRMRDIEFILRFFALSSAYILDEKKAPPRISLKKFLSEYMDSEEKLDLAHLSARFSRTCSFILEHIGLSAFHNSASGSTRGNASFSPTVFDSVMIGTDIALENGLREDPQDLGKKRDKLLAESAYQSLLYQETMRTANIRERVKLMHEALFGDANE